MSRVLYHVEWIMVHGCERYRPVHLTVCSAGATVLLTLGILAELLALAVGTVLGEDEAGNVHEEFKHLGQSYHTDANPQP